MRFLVLRFDAPLMAFGDVAVDELRPSDRLPGASLLTGLLANALGYDHREPERHQRLQERLYFAVREDLPGRTVRDYQTARIHKDDRLWTTHGRAERRTGGGSTWDETGWGTVPRERFYRADAVVTVALALRPVDERPSLDDLRAALERPERPLFIGRKGCLPAAPLLDRCRPEVEAPSARDALFRVPLAPARGRWRRPSHARLFCRWPVGDGAEDAVREERIADLRNWYTGLHEGERRLLAAHLPAERFLAGEPR